MNLITVSAINLIFILISTFIFIYFFIERFSIFYIRFRKAAITGLAGIQIVFCIETSFLASNQFMYDLRLIPMMLGGLYGGPVVSMVLFLVTALARFLSGGPGSWLSFFNTLTITVYVTYISTKFITFSLLKKFGVVSGITLSFSTLLFLMKAVIFHQPTNLSFILLYSFAHIIGAIIVTYLIELTKQNYYLHDVIIQSDKTEVVSHLAASVSHEVRNPLTVTRGFLQLLKEPALPEDKRLYYLSTAMDELDRAERIIKDYLTFAKHHPNDPSSFEIKEEIEKVLELLYPYANNHSVRFIKNLTSGLYVNGDYAKFQQCILNLVKNGIEAMPDGGDLLICCYQKVDHSIFIFIEDTGYGMSESQLANLGKPYFSTKSEQGTGLGMMVVYKIIQEMDGEIEVKSKLDEGTRFLITLPLSTERQNER